MQRVFPLVPEPTQFDLTAAEKLCDVNKDGVREAAGGRRLICEDTFAGNTCVSYHKWVGRRRSATREEEEVQLNNCQSVSHDNTQKF